MPGTRRLKCRVGKEKEKFSFSFFFAFFLKKITTEEDMCRHIKGVQVDLKLRTTKRRFRITEIKIQCTSANCNIF